jgi:hypothetical protein
MFCWVPLAAPPPLVLPHPIKVAATVATTAVIVMVRRNINAS